MDLRIVHCSLNSGSINVKLLAGGADFGQLEDDIRRAIPLSDAERAPVKPAGGKVFAERAGKQREPFRDQLIDTFGRDDQ